MTDRDRIEKRLALLQASLSNLETLVEIDDATVVASAEAWIEEHIAGSRRITMDECARSAWHRWVGDRLGLVVAHFAQLFGRLLNWRR